MNPQTTIVGENLRRIRSERRLSLATVAQQAAISIATLSRVETSKQTADVELLLTLARILDVSPAEILSQPSDKDDPNALTRSLSRLRSADRAKVFIDSGRRGRRQDTAAVVDDLLLTIDVMREKLLQMQQDVERRGKR